MEQVNETLRRLERVNRSKDNHLTSVWAGVRRFESPENVKRAGRGKKLTEIGFELFDVDERSSCRRFSLLVSSGRRIESSFVRESMTDVDSTGKLWSENDSNRFRDELFDEFASSINRRFLEGTMAALLIDEDEQFECFSSLEQSILFVSDCSSPFSAMKTSSWNWSQSRSWRRASLPSVTHQFFCLTLDRRRTEHVERSFR